MADDDAFRPGFPVDAGGNPAIDPTENVKALNAAAGRRQDDLREAETRFQNFAREAAEKRHRAIRMSDYQLQTFAREAVDRFQNYARQAESSFQTSMRERESVRIDQLAQLRQVYETRIAEMLSKSVESTSSLVSTQLVQIQATFNERVSKLEQFRWESGGRASVSDPAIADALSKLGANILSLTDATAVAMSKTATANAEAIEKLATGISTLKTSEMGTASRGMGRSEVVAWFAAGAFGLAAIIVPIMIAVFSHHP